MSSKICLFRTVNFLLKKLKSFFCYFRIGSGLIRYLTTTTTKLKWNSVL